MSLVYCVARLSQRALHSALCGAERDRPHSRCIARDTARVMARLSCGGMGIRVQVVDEHHLLAVQPCVIIANHQSFVDYPILAAIFPARTTIVGKAEIGRMPLIGWLFRATGNVLLARHDRHSAAETMDTLVDVVRADGRNIWMFPEGTRRRTPAAMLPFKSGAFRVAAISGAPIVPVVISALAPDIDAVQRRLVPTTVTVRVLPPRHVTMRTREQLAADIATTRTEMSEVFCAISDASSGHRHAPCHAERDTAGQSTD